MRLGKVRFLSVSFLVAVYGGMVSPMQATAGVSPKSSTNVPPARGPGSNFDRLAYEQGMKDAPAILDKIGIACTVKQALFAGGSTLLDGNGKSIGHARLYEVACDEGMGYMLNVRGKEAPVAFDCIGAGRTGKAACMLPLNSHPAGGLDPFLKAAGAPCVALRARSIGQDITRKIRRYEVSCREGGGYILDIPLADGSGPAPSATDCFQDESECRFTPHVEDVAMLAYKIGKSFGKSCRIGDARYVGHVAAHDRELYEVSCQQDRDGQLIEVDQLGAVRSDTGCLKVKLVGAACQLKPVDAVDPLIERAEAAGVGSPSPVTVTNPDWLRRPTGEQIGELYPRLAQINHVSGQIELNCRVATSGAVENCVIIDECPAGFGFGAAALKMSTAFQMRPMAVNGLPVSGAQVEIPINFAMGP